MNGRAETPEQKRVVIERIYAAWLKCPSQRFGQFISNATYTELDTFHIEDEAIVVRCEALADRNS